jgi:hypothetical protein
MLKKQVYGNRMKNDIKSQVGTSERMKSRKTRFYVLCFLIEYRERPINHLPSRIPAVVEVFRWHGQDRLT